MDGVKALGHEILAFLVQKTSLNAALRLFGVELLAVQAGSQDEGGAGKRKRSPVAPASNCLEEEDDDGAEQEGEVKRWRPDTIYQAIQEFMGIMWGEKDSNENLKERAAINNNETDDDKWNSKPNLNFHASPLRIDLEEAEEKVFVFSAEKESCMDMENGAVEQDRSLPRMTFTEKQAYFARQIKDQAKEVSIERTIVLHQ